jgi:hypothetical protein
MLHALLAAVLSQLPAPEVMQPSSELHLHLANPPESPRPPMLIMAALPESAPPPEPTVTPQPTPPTVDEQTLRELAEERTRLREELRRASSPESLPPLPEPVAKAPNQPSPPPPPRQGDLSTIRELSMEGYPDSIVGEVMRRYRMQVKLKVVQGGTNQSFLSSASSNKGDTFLADRNSPPGLYQVFELSRDAVTRMSALEEQAIRERGMDPERTHVKRIKFGIVQNAGEYDLGVLEIEAEPV